MKQLMVFIAGLGLGIMISGSSWAENRSLVSEESTLLYVSVSPLLAHQLLQAKDTTNLKFDEKLTLGSNPPVKNTKKFSFQEKPGSQCRSFLITEFGYLLRFDVERYTDRRHYANWELGGMVNQGENSALGATFFFTLDQEYEEPRIGIKARYRRWISPNSSLDIAPGVILYGWRRHFKFPSFAGHIGLNLGNWFALVGQVESTRWKNHYYDFILNGANIEFIEGEKIESDMAWYGGFKLRTPLVAGGATLAVGTIAVIIGLAVADFSINMAGF